MTGANVIPAENIGLILADEMTREQKMALVLSYTDKCLCPYDDAAKTALAESDGFIINNEADRSRASSEAVRLRSLLKKIDDFRETRLRPTKRDIRTIESRIAETETAVKTAIGRYDGALKEIWLKEEEAREAVQAMHNAAAGGDNFVYLAETERTVSTELGKTTIRNDIEVIPVSLADIVDAASRKEFPYIVLKVDIQAAKKYFKAAGVRKATGFVIKDAAIVAGREK